jgi:hypothetical protein
MTRVPDFPGNRARLKEFARLFIVYRGSPERRAEGDAFMRFQMSEEREQVVRSRIALCA